MLTYYYLPLDADVVEIEVLRQLYKHCKDKSFICEYSLASLSNSCDKRLNITKRKIETILKNFEAKGWIKHINKGVGRNKSTLKVTFISSNTFIYMFYPSPSFKVF